MERQVGLGRSLEDVLDSLAPAEPDATGSTRGLFDPEDLEQQLDTLMGDMRDLRERVQHLVSMVPDDVLDDARPQRLGLVKAPDADEEHRAGEHDDSRKKKKHGKKHASKKHGKKHGEKHGKKHGKKKAAKKKKHDWE